MQAIILAAGRGSRMKHMTEDAPKCLTVLQGRPLLDWQEHAIHSAGIEKITIVCGYKSEKIPDRFNKVTNNEWQTSNMVVSLTKCHDILSTEDCIVSYSDIVYHPDHITSLKTCNGSFAITYDKLWLDLWSLRFENPLADAETFEQKDGVLLEIGNKTTNINLIQGQYMGLLKITPTAWLSIREFLQSLSPEALNRMDMTSMIKELLKKGMKISTVPVNGKWCETDSSDDLEKYENVLSSGIAWNHDWRS